MGSRLDGFAHALAAERCTRVEAISVVEAQLRERESALAALTLVYVHIPQSEFQANFCAT